MTLELKLKVLVQMLRLTPASKSMLTITEFEDRGDLDGLWDFYQGAMQIQPEMRSQVERGGQVSFEMLRPAMEAVYRLAEEPC